MKPENITYELFKQSVASVLVYYDELKVTQISESPSISLVNLVANIGGTCGLFIGMSVLTIVEFFELIFGLAVIFGFNYWPREKNLPVYNVKLKN